MARCVSRGAVVISDRTQRSITASFQLLGEVGRGQYGRVHCARRRRTGEWVALKELPFDRFPTHALLRELRYLLSLDHPHITRCEALIHAQEGRFLVLEYCEGGTLRDLLTHAAPLSQAQILDVMAQILAGLDHAHHQGLVHCDVKPENILVKPTPSGWCLKLTDFGIARHTRPDHRQIGTTGSPAYMAPERFYGEVYPASDLYSLGILLYELLAGHRPFSGSPGQLQHDHLNRPPQIAPDLPRPWRPILEQALRKLPLRRFHTATQFQQALDRIAPDLEDAPHCPVLRPAVQLPQVIRSYPLPLLPDVAMISELPQGDLPSSPRLTCGIETRLFSFPLASDLAEPEWAPESESEGSPSDRITALYPLTRDPEIDLAITERGSYLSVPGKIPSPLLHLCSPWHHHFVPQRDRLYWSGVTEWGLVDLHACLPPPDPESTPEDKTSTQILQIPQISQIRHYYRWPQASIPSPPPRILHLTPQDRDHIALIHSSPQGATLQLYPQSPIAIDPQHYHSYPLPYPVRAVLPSWKGQALWLLDPLDPRRITQVSLSPFQIRSVWIDTPITQLVAAPWGVMAVTALGRAWCMGITTGPLAQLEIGPSAQILRLNPDRTAWILTSQVLHTSGMTAGTRKPSGWITQIDLSCLPPSGPDLH